MVTRNVSALSLRRFVPCAAIALLTLVPASSAEARARGFFRHPAHSAHRRPVAHAARANFGSSVGANFAAMVVDANSGRTLYAVNEDAPRHPASITKVMTLFLLFEELEKGHLRLDSPLLVSAHAAAQSPTKLGLRPGSTIAVENAIKAIVTKSANDMAVAVAENIAGDEEAFAEAMTEKAHALGMMHTFYHNASGLPDMRQLTTARDLTILGRVIRERFPRYYHYFSIPSFTYAGSVMPNHNHLLGRIDGMDGIKTGYTAASGFNLLTSVKRDGRHLVSVVLGGRTAASRDRVMQALIETHIEEASATPGTRMADSSPVEQPAPAPSRERVEAPVDVQPPMRRREVAQAEPDDEAAQDDAAAPMPVTFSSSEDTQRGNVERQPPRGPNLIAPELAVPAAPLSARPRRAAAPAVVARPAQVAAVDLPIPTPRPVVAAPVPRPAASGLIKAEKIRPAFISGAPKLIEAARLPGPMGVKDRQRLALDGSTNRRPEVSASASNAVATATPSSLHWVVGAQPVKSGPSAESARAGAGKPAAEPSTTGSIERASTKTEKADSKAETPISASSRGGWVIQIGATDDAGKANELLSRAKSEGRSALASARPFTEKIQKGDSTLYRARFAGLEPSEAEAACKALKRSGFACFATHN